MTSSSRPSRNPALAPLLQGPTSVHHAPAVTP